MRCTRDGDGGGEVCGLGFSCALAVWYHSLGEVKL